MSSRYEVLKITHVPTGTEVLGSRASTEMRSQREVRAWLLRLLRCKLRAGCFAPLPLRRSYELDANGNLVAWERREHEDPELSRTATEQGVFEFSDYAALCRQWDRYRETIDNAEWREARRKEQEALHAATWGNKEWVEARRAMLRAEVARKRADLEGWE